MALQSLWHNASDSPCFDQSGLQISHTRTKNTKGKENTTKTHATQSQNMCEAVLQPHFTWPKVRRLFRQNMTGLWHTAPVWRCYATLAGLHMVQASHEISRLEPSPLEYSILPELLFEQNQCASASVPYASLLPSASLHEAQDRVLGHIVQKPRAAIPRAAPLLERL